MGSMMDKQSDAKRYTEVTCDLCDSPDYTPLYKLVHSSIVKCRNCGFNFVSPRVSTDAIQAALQAWAELDVIDEERIRIAFDPNTLELYRRYATWVDKFRETNQVSLLDVGCSTGALLTVFSKEGWDVQGIELGKASSSYAANQLGLNVFRGSLYDFPCMPDSIDVVTFTEVIEHLESPKAALKRIYTWLKPGGIIFITTPNFNSLYRKRFGSQWWVINCEEEHIMFFTPESLKRLLEICGYTVVFEHIRGIDMVGMLKQAGKRVADEAKGSNQVTNMDGYYVARDGKEKFKRVLHDFGVLKLARYILRALDYLFSKKWSPLYSWGEQLIIIAKKN
jgi:2-polyprenyl-3-methyl-5-hydroxy-6-metoxy-1,4-benzoquinol methylase